MAGLVLAAGKGERLRPLTATIPKPLLSVGGSTLLDLAIQSLPLPPSDVMVNASYLAAQIQGHLGSTGVQVSFEPEPLGSAGAVGAIKQWVGERGLMIRNADMWFDAVPKELWADWSGERPRLLVQETGRPADFGTQRFLGWSLLPARDVMALQPVRSGLLDLVWRPALERGALELVVFEGLAIDCGTIDDLARARALSQ